MRQILIVLILLFVFIDQTNGKKCQPGYSLKCIPGIYLKRIRIPKKCICVKNNSTSTPKKSDNEEKKTTEETKKTAENQTSSKPKNSKCKEGETYVCMPNIRFRKFRLRKKCFCVKKN